MPRVSSILTVWFVLLAGPLAADEVKKVALVVGVNSYTKRGFSEQPLQYAERDATALHEELSRCGFEAKLLLGSGAGAGRADRVAVEAALNGLLTGRNAKDIVLVAFAGHGAQFGVRDATGAVQMDAFFCPLDAVESDATTMISLSNVIDRLSKRGGRNLLLVDACRNDPNPNRGRGIDGDTVARLPLNTAVLFSCSKGQKAFESAKAGGGHGIFFHFVLEGLRGNASDANGEIDWDGLKGYVVRQVTPELFKQWIPEAGIDPQSPHGLSNFRGRSPVLSTRAEYVVAPEGKADYRTIADALAKVPAGARIVVKPGLYREQLVLTKAVEVIGDGRRDEIVVENTLGNCVVMRAKRATVKGLTIRCKGSAEAASYAVDIPEGRLVLEDCAISSTSMACVGVHGTTADPVIRDCRIHDGRTGGLYFYDGASGTVEGCDLFGHEMAAIEVMDRSDPIVRDCTLRGGKQSGIFVHKQGRGTFRNCTIENHQFAGVSVGSGATPLFRGCKIRDGKYSGAMVFDGGLGTFEDCEITGHGSCGVEIRTKGNPVLRKCRITKNDFQAIWLHDEGAGTVEECDLTGNRIGAWLIQNDCKVTSRNNKE